MPELCTIYDYMRAHAALLGDRILQEYPALHQFDHPVSTRITGLLRTPFPAQTIAIMGVAKRWQHARTSMVVAECGTGKTLIALGAIHVHSQGSPFTALAMVPPHLVEKWAREAFLTLPGIRVFLIDDLRNGGDENKSHGVNEVRLRQGRIVREGLHTTLSELRLRKGSPSSRKRWLSLCGRPSLFIVGRERAKLGYFWRHAYRVPHSGPYVGCIVNSDTGKPVIVDESRLTAGEFEKVKIAETIETRGEKSCRPLHSPLWQADADKIRRMAPIEFIGRYMPEWFDYAICDEIHQLAGDTAQGNALGTLASCTDRIVGLTEDQPPALHDRPRRWRIGAGSDDHHSRWQEASPQITLMAWTSKRVLLHNTKTGTSETRDIQHVFMMTGADPNTEWLRGSLVLDAKGFIKTGVEVQEGWPLHWLLMCSKRAFPGFSRLAISELRA